MKRVVLLTSKPKRPGGLEKNATRIAEAFRARGGNVTTLSGVEWSEKVPAEIILGLDRYRYQTHLRAGNGSHLAFLKSRILSEGRLKYYSCFFNPKHRRILQIEKTSFENPALKKLFVNSHMVKKQILEHYNVNPEKVVVIHNGVEWNEMEPDFEAWPEKKSDPTFTFLFIGHGFVRKGLNQLLQAVDGLKGTRLYVIGQDKNLTDYQKRAPNNVHFFGPQSNVRPFYQQADALVIPSFYDPFANVTVEALAMGLRVVSSKFNGGAEILTPNTGHIIDNLLSPDSIRASLLDCIRFPKTVESALACRTSVKHLDYATQLNLLVDHCYE